jgi:hypothetical protein
MANMVKQSKNIVKIVGVLVENSLKQNTYKNKEGKDTEYISGTLTIRTNQQISGKDEISDIPVSVWVAKYTKEGKINPAYESMVKAMNYVSLCVSENESTATKVLITSGNITENIYSVDGEKIYCTPRIQTNFINSVTNPSNYIPEATFTTDIVVGNIEDETNPKDGATTGRLKVKGMVCRYNGTMDVIDYVVENPNAINYIRSYWKNGDTVQISGKIRFNVKTEQIEVPTRFGDPVFKTKTSNCRELVITADSTDALTDEQKFTEAEVTAGLDKRKQIIEDAKNKSKKSTSTPAASPAAATNQYGF